MKQYYKELESFQRLLSLSAQGLAYLDPSGEPNLQRAQEKRYKVMSLLGKYSKKLRILLVRRLLILIGILGFMNSTILSIEGLLLKNMIKFSSRKFGKLACTRRIMFLA